MSWRSPRRGQESGADPRDADALLQLTFTQRKLRKARLDIRDLSETIHKCQQERHAECEKLKKTVRCLRARIYRLRDHLRGQSHDDAGAATDSQDEADVGPHEQEEEHDPMHELLRLADVACEDEDDDVQWEAEMDVQHQSVALLTTHTA